VLPTNFFGRGQRIELLDGSRWRIKSVGQSGKICPAIFDSEIRRIAVSSLGVGTYGINGRDYGCVIYASAGRRFGRFNDWIIREYEDELATRHAISTVSSDRSATSPRCRSAWLDPGPLWGVGRVGTTAQSQVELRPWTSVSSIA